MNRLQRRALARTIQRRITREHFPLEKLTHKLAPQRCALWIPETGGYVVDFCLHGFKVVDCAELARHYTDDDASTAAATFKRIFGLRVVVRPVYPHQLSQAGASLPERLAIVAGDADQAALDASGGPS